jgi:hypothetical protein
MGKNMVNAKKKREKLKEEKETKDKIKSKPKMHSRCFGIMGGHRNLAFNLVVKLSVDLGYVFLSLRL